MLKLNIGCGTHSRGSGEDLWTYCDITPGPTTDVVFDATKDWPFPDNSADTIRANHVLEHLVDYKTFFKEAHRVLIPNGYFHITVPYGLGSGGMADITHVKYWLPGSFTCVQPGYAEDVFNPQLSNWTAPYSVEICLLRVSGPMWRLTRWPWRQLGAMKLLNHLVDGYSEVTVMLRALKTPEAVAHFRKERKGNEIPVHRVIHRNEYEGKEYKGGPIELVFLDQHKLGVIHYGELANQIQEFNK